LRQRRVEQVGKWRSSGKLQNVPYIGMLKEALSCLS